LVTGFRTFLIVRPAASVCPGLDRLPTSSVGGSLLQAALVVVDRWASFHRISFSTCRRFVQ